MGPYTLCIGPPVDSDVDDTAGEPSERRLGRWRELGVPVLAYGEWGHGDDEQSPLCLADLRTTPTDAPRLDDLLQRLHSRLRSRTLVLIRAEARPTPAWCDALAELALRQQPVLAFGRAWQVGVSGGPGHLDAPHQPSWVLLPRGPWQPPAHQATELAADPAAALPWLLELARQQGWDSLDATDAAPLERGPGPGWSSEPASNDNMGDWTAVRRLGRATAGPQRLSLLLPEPVGDIERWRQELVPAACLPWELIEAAPTAWEHANGELIWSLPPGSEPPPIALLPVLLRALRNPRVDGVALGEATALLRRPLLERLGAAGFRPDVSRSHGLQLLTLPLRIHPPAGHTGDPHGGDVSNPDPLWLAAESQLSRAEALLLAQRRRIDALEARISAEVPPPPPQRPAPPARPPGDPAAG